MCRHCLKRGSSVSPGRVFPIFLWARGKASGPLSPVTGQSFAEVLLCLEVYVPLALMVEDRMEEGIFMNTLEFVQKQVLSFCCKTSSLG